MVTQPTRFYLLPSTFSYYNNTPDSTQRLSLTPTLPIQKGLDTSMKCSTLTLGKFYQLEAPTCGTHAGSIGCQMFCKPVWELQVLDRPPRWTHGDG